VSIPNDRYRAGGRGYFGFESVELHLPHCLIDGKLNGPVNIDGGVDAVDQQNESEQVDRQP